MTMTQLPMFPLGNVVLPGELLPLNVFEPRYRQLVLDCLAAEVPEFGVVLIERGSEVGGGDVRTSIGTVARIVRVTPLGGGRFEVVAAGVRRANVLEWLADDPYPRGDVEDWPEAEAVTPKRCGRRSSACVTGSRRHERSPARSPGQASSACRSAPRHR